ncbi:hypothetical protein COU74_04140 [Candidatus Peregrinibacteria bacterium CG10_big_fil_rev_8_21_14_0_10_36_19]|nr:MAG: hypothetical protein COU74_04140 [Candidatus Peregrinibacteria bacterium CG10_big_fil_rev_8_21_14_0_10_36_19]
MKTPFFINRLPVTWLIILGIIISGAYSIKTIPREIQPEINIPIAAVTVALPGANPSDIESLITEPLEKSISNTEEIKKLTSTSTLGLATIVVEFNANADIDKAIQDLKDKVDLAKSELPEDATDPNVIRAKANETAIISFSLIGNRPLYELTKIAEDLQDSLEAHPNISKARISGAQKKIIEVEINQAKAESYGLNINQIIQLIKFSNYNLPLGIISTDKLNYSINVDSRYQSIEDIKNITILPNIYLKDVASVTESHNTQQVTSRLSIDGKKSKNSLSIQVFKKDKSNVITTVDDAKEIVKNFPLEKDIQIVVSNDLSEQIRQDLGVLTNNGIQTTILIIVMLFLALGLTEGLLAGLSIPLTLLSTITIISAAGMTINSLTLFSMVIAVGLMVDTAIVIMEGIHDNMKSGKSSKEAAINAIQTYQWPLIAGTLTTVFAFFPMLLVSGIVGQFLKSLPITISAALFSSLFISLTVIPAIAGKTMKGRNLANKSSILEPLFHKAGSIFQRLISKILTSRLARLTVILTSIILLIASFILPISGALKVEMFPKTDFRYFIINIEAPKGLVLSETEKIVQTVEEKLYKVPEIESFLSIIGTKDGIVQTDLVEFSGGGNSNLANITVNLVEEKDRSEKSYVIADRIRTELSKINTAKVTVRELTEGPPSDSPVAVKIVGKDTEKLRKISNDFQKMLKEIPGTQNITTTLQDGLNQFTFKLDQDKLSKYSLSGLEVSNLIRTSLQGREAATVTLNEEDLSIYVKYDLPKINDFTNANIETIKNFQITSRTGEQVSFGELAEIKFTTGLQKIDHEEQERIIKVKSDIEKDANAIDITTQFQEKVNSYKLDKGYRVEFGGDTQDVQESFQDLFRSMIIGVILIAFTLVLIFNSLKQPFIILLTLPLALIGVFPGLMSIGLALSFPAFLGVVALAGVVVNDAIVLIDRINNNRKEGMEFTQSIAEAGNARLQPIIMTSITTIAGILPLALTNEFWAGLGFSLVFGLACATILTLIVIPTLYYMFEKKNS